MIVTARLAGRMIVAVVVVTLILSGAHRHTEPNTQSRLRVGFVKFEI